MSCVSPGCQTKGSSNSLREQETGTVEQAYIRERTPEVAAEAPTQDIKLPGFPVPVNATHVLYPINYDFHEPRPIP